jgi:hypothetical protein
MSDTSSPRILNEDQREVTLKHLKEAAYACQTLHGMLAKSAEVPDISKDVLSVAEFRLADAGKALGIETDGAQDIAERYVKLRAANDRIRELEAQLGAGASIAQTVAHLKHLGKVLNNWWDQEGFGHISNMRFTEHGSLEVKLSCHLFGNFRLIDSDTPVSDKTAKAQWFQELRDRGYDLVDEDRNGRDMALMDSPATRDTLFALLRRNFPSVRISETSNHCDSSGVMLLKDVRVYIHDLEDIAALASHTAGEA